MDTNAMNLLANLLDAIAENDLTKQIKYGNHLIATYPDIESKLNDPEWWLDARKTFYLRDRLPQRG